MKTKVNEIPLVGPKGRKELLKRISELEAQIAQQGSTVIEIDSIEDLTEDEKAKIQNAHTNGTIFNVILKVEGGNWYTRILADLIGVADAIVVWVNPDYKVGVVDVS